MQTSPTMPSIDIIVTFLPVYFLMMYSSLVNTGIMQGSTDNNPPRCLVQISCDVHSSLSCVMLFMISSSWCLSCPSAWFWAIFLSRWRANPAIYSMISLSSSLTGSGSLGVVRGRLKFSFRRSFIMILDKLAKTGFGTCGLAHRFMNWWYLDHAASRDFTKNGFLSFRQQFSHCRSFSKSLQWKKKSKFLM